MLPRNFGYARFALYKHLAEIGLGNRITLFRRFAIPQHCHPVINRCTLPFVVHLAQIKLGSRIPLTASARNSLNAIEKFLARKLPVPPSSSIGNGAKHKQHHSQNRPELNAQR